MIRMFVGLLYGVVVERDRENSYVSIRYLPVVQHGAGAADEF
jgi:hypothetical protein